MSKLIYEKKMNDLKYYCRFNGFYFFCLFYIGTYFTLLNY